ncbi:alpha/beta fold hydrolase [Salinibius halmophilus]|uniref:alpha/beta fold hydrolase n=1 Tax=Salinibius halmophilus TaxID=1853216 RepID=UPI001314692E|nr:alpha/beta hydrolase [Salinibius halmophilus]
MQQHPSLSFLLQASEFYSLDASVSRLIALLDQLDAQNVVLVGNSFGGVIATHALAVAPERFEGVVFVDAAVYVEEKMPK